MKRLAYILMVLTLASAASAQRFSIPVTFSGYTRNETLTNFPALITFSNYTGFLSNV